MRIGIDAKWYFTGNISGRIVIKNLLHALSNASSEHKYIVILDDRDKQRSFPYVNHPNFEIVYCKTYTNQLANILSPLQLKRFHLDACVYQYFAPFFSPFKRIMYIHDIIFESNPEYFSAKERLYFRLMKLMAHRAHGVVTVSKTEEARLKQYGYIRNHTKLSAIHNGIGDEFHKLCPLTSGEVIRVRERYNLPDKFLLYLGRINERKNVATLIKSLRYLPANIELVIAGERDWSKQDIAKTIIKEGVKGRVKFTGFVQQEDITVLYRLATAFCYLSFDEGFGLPVAEAMACGTSVVVSDTPIHREICGDAAFYANPYDPLDVANSINSALNNTGISNHKKKAGQTIVQQYKWSNAAARLIEFVEQL